MVSRTPRELVIIGVAAATAIASARRHGSADLGNLLAFAAIAVGFSLRFFAARVITTAILVAAAGLHVIYAWHAGWPPRELLSIAYFLGGILLLGGRALVAVYDDAPARGPLPNFWRELATGDRRRLALLVHGVALTAAMLYYVRYQLVQAHQPVPAWLTAGLAGTAVVAALLLAGRALAAGLALVAGTALAVVLVAHAPAAWSVTSGAYVSVTATPAVARVAPELILGAAAAATFTVVAATPWAWRLVRLSLR